MNNAMIDLETWGTRPGAAIRSVGAVMFDPYGEGTGAEFYMNISDASCHEAGLHRDQSTIEWWDRQSKEAKASLMKDPRPLRDVAVEFVSWFKRQRAIFVWGQGSNFDPVLWEAALRAVQHEPPWRFFDCFDTRTAYSMARFDSRSVKRRGTYHNALDDAKHQALCVQKAFARVQVKML